MVSEAEVPDGLRICAEGRANDGWRNVYLPTVKVYHTSDSAFIAHLSALQRAGLYKPAYNMDWGQVLIPASNSAATTRFQLTDADEIRYCRTAGFQVDETVHDGRQTFFGYLRC